MDNATTATDGSTQPEAVDPSVSGTPVDPGTATPEGSPGTDVSALQNQLTEQQAAMVAMQKSMEAVAAKNKELLSEKKTEQARNRDALEEQGKYQEVASAYKLELAEAQAVAVGTQDKLTAAESRVQSLSPYVESVAGLAKQELSGMAETDRTQFGMLYPGAVEADADPLAILTAISNFRQAFPAGAARRPGSGIPGGGVSGKSDAATMAEYRKSGDSQGALRHLLNIKR